MTGIQNFNSISFGSNYIIPFDQVKNSQTMRDVGVETAKYVQNPNDIAPHPQGIIVKVDDVKDKEYEAVIAKYGINIHKYDEPMPSRKDLETHAYSYMVTKLHPDDAKQKIEEFNTMDDKQKGMAYLDTYNEFKNSKYSIENQMKNMPPKIKPTDKPVIKFTAPNGEKLMAREVQLENGYTCIAIANEKNPSQTMLLNKEEFQKFIKEIYRK